MTALIDSLKGMLKRGNDTALLRFSLGSEYLKSGELPLALEHLQRAIALDENYSAAWKMLGQAQQAAGLMTQAVTSYQQGISIAESRGDIQAAKEMRVFLRRIQRQRGAAADDTGRLKNQIGQ